MFYAVLLGVGLFFFGWGVAFFVSLAYAPVQIDAESQDKIIQLTAALELPDKVLADHLGSLLTEVSDNAKAVLKFVLLYDDDMIHGREMAKIDELSFEDMQKARQECIDATLLRAEYEHADFAGPMAFAKGRSFYFVPQEFRKTLKLLLYQKS